MCFESTTKIRILASGSLDIPSSAKSLKDLWHMAQFLVAHPIPAARIPVVGHSMDLNAEIQRLRRDSAAQRLVISQLRMRVEELEEDCEDLQGICAANGVDHREPLAAV